MRTPARACQLAHEGCRRRVVDRALGTPENPPPLPRSCPQHRSEHPESLERCDRPLRRPTNHAELLHPATAAGHSRLREASNRPKHARFAGVVSGEARSAAAGRGRWLAQKPQGPPFFPSRALGPVLMPSARGRWPFFVRPAPKMANQIAQGVTGSREQTITVLSRRAPVPQYHGSKTQRRRPRCGWYRRLGSLAER